MTAEGIFHIEPNVRLARIIFAQRRARSHIFKGIKMNEPAWDILLFLFINQRGTTNVRRLCGATDLSHATGLRYINWLNDAGYTENGASANDARARIIMLSDRGLAAMNTYLTSIADIAAKAD